MRKGSLLMVSGARKGGQNLQISIAAKLAAMSPNDLLSLIRQSGDLGEKAVDVLVRTYKSSCLFEAEKAMAQRER